MPEATNPNGKSSPQRTTTEMAEVAPGESNPSDDHRRWVLEWLDQFEQQLIQYATRLSQGQHEIAVDAVQHAFLKLCDQSPEVIGNRLPGWLYRVCRNKVIDELRNRGRDEMAIDKASGLLPQRETGPADAAESAEMSAVLKKLMDRLSKSQREAIDLWCRGFRYREIAEITGKSYGSVRVTVHRGLEQLRNHPRVKRWLDESTQTHPATLTE